MNTVKPSVLLGKFIVLTFTLSWGIWIPLALLRWGIAGIEIPEELGSLLSFLGVLMPAFAALMISARAGQARALLTRLLLWRVNWKWWVAAVFVQPSLLGITTIIYRIIFGKMPVAVIPQASASGLIVTIIFLLLATLGEEIGWRGLALPALEARYNAFTASLVLGLFYIAWHTLYWLAIGALQQFGSFYFLLNYLFAIPLTFYITWFYNRGHFSLLLAVAFHLTFNIANTAILPVTSNITAFGILITLEWLIALPLFPALKVDTANPKHLVKGTIR